MSRLDFSEDWALAGETARRANNQQSASGPRWALPSPQSSIERRLDRNTVLSRWNGQSSRCILLNTANGRIVKQIRASYLPAYQRIAEVERRRNFTRQAERSKGADLDRGSRTKIISRATCTGRLRIRPPAGRGADRAGRSRLDGRGE